MCFSVVLAPGILVENQLVTLARLILDFNSVLLMYRSIFMLVPCSLDYCSRVTSYEAGKCELFKLYFLILKIVLAMLGLLHFHNCHNFGKDCGEP